MIHIAIMGMGVVGGGLADAILKNNEIVKNLLGDELNIKYILDRRSFPGHPLENRVVGDINVILNDPEVSVVAETMGGDNPAYDFTLACLKAGKSVVSSNKLVVEKYGRELEKEAIKNNVSYLYEASAGGGIPLIHPLVHCLSANKITKIAGILNGTTNYILNRMETDGISFDEALADAKRLGYAEANPDADVLGFDTARKIAILASVCFGSYFSLEDLAEIEGITHITKEQIEYAGSLGYKLKLLGVAEQNGNDEVTLFVKPCLVSREKLLYGVNGVFNCVLATGNLVGEVGFYGHGAGGLATASAVLSDIIEAVKIKTPPLSKPNHKTVVKNLDLSDSIDILGVKYPII
ncbi:MAG: homoserine dehydrogenase [Eubacteriales bacterium]|jgi:homoserine dehydrogenase